MVARISVWKDKEKTIFTKNNKGHEVVESYDRLHPERKEHTEEEEAGLFLFGIFPKYCSAIHLFKLSR